VGIGVSHLSKNPTVSNEWTVWEGGISNTQHLPSNAQATFQRVLDSVRGPEMESFALAYLDDIVVIGQTKQEELEKLREVMRRLRKANLRTWSSLYERMRRAC